MKYSDTPVDAEAPPKRSEKLLMEYLPEVEAERVLCSTQGHAQFAVALAEQSSATTIRCHFLDLYLAEQAQQRIPEKLKNLSLECSPDFPEEEYDLAAFPFSKSGTAELTQELIQQAHLRLTLKGKLVAATDNPRDQWLHEQLDKIFSKVTRRPSKKGVLYIAEKSEPLKKEKNFIAEVGFRDQGNLILGLSRPGVFSHRKIDAGTRQLINTMEINDGNHVLDIGCGWGAASLAAAFRAKDVKVEAIDSNARAVECTMLSAERNELKCVQAELNSQGENIVPKSFQVALANPPYYAGYRIAQHFLKTAHEALEESGRAYVVTKHPQWYEENMPNFFQEVEILPVKEYFVATGTRGAADIVM